MVVGIEHPGELRRAGDQYRRALNRQVADLGVEQHVQFVRRYLSDDELSTLLNKVELCVLPYNDCEQAVSGTLARALGAGCAVVATAFRHAREVGDRGGALVVPMRNPAALADAVARTLTDHHYRWGLQQQALAVAASMRWNVVGARYERLLRRVANNGTTGRL